MRIDLVKTSFTAGEIAPDIQGRADIAQYDNACQVVENMVVRPYGPLLSTPGTEYINDAKHSGGVSGGGTPIGLLLSLTTAGSGSGVATYYKTRVIPFVFSKDDAYIIETGPSYFRFYTDGAVVNQ